MKKEITIKNILNEFDEKFNYCFNVGVTPDDMTKVKIKIFISQKLNEILDEVGQMKRKRKTGNEYMARGDVFVSGYNQAVEELNNKIKKLIK